MKLLTEKDTIDWTYISSSVGDLYFCKAVNVNCPLCSQRGTFTMNNVQADPNRFTASATGVCPTCHQNVYFWFVNNKDDCSYKTCSAFMYPFPAPAKDFLFQLGLITNERIKQSYKDALDVYNAGIWSGSLTLARRTLEGIVSDIKPESTGTLAAKLKELQSAKLEKPLLELTEAVKDGGNFGAHFDPNLDPDKEMASAALELLGYLIEYIYVLPTMVKRLKDQVSKDK